MYFQDYHVHKIKTKDKGIFIKQSLYPIKELIVQSKKLFMALN